MSEERPLHRFLEVFFGPGNDLRWEQVQPGANKSLSDALRPFLCEVGVDWEQLILPRKSGGKLRWYAIARDAPQGRILREQLLAFVGPSYADFRGQAADLDPADPIEAAVFELGGHNVFRVDVVDLGLKTRCRLALTRLLELRGRKPSGTRIVPRPPGAVLRDFELAVLSRARANAEGYLRELDRLGGTSARNRRFLRVHLHRAFEEWDALTQILDDGALVQARRPLRVTRALIEVVYRNELARFESTGEPELALQHFKNAVLPRYGRLYQSLTGLDGSAIIKSFLLNTAAATNPSASRRDALVERHAVNAPDRLYVEALGRLTVSTQPVPIGPLARMKAAFLDGEIDVAFEGLLELEKSADVMGLLIRCALELGTPDAAADALGFFEAAPDEVQHAFSDKPRLAKALSVLWAQFDASDAMDADSATELRRSVAPMPNDWAQWFARVVSDPQWSGAVRVAEQGALEWSTAAAANSPELLEPVVAALASELPAVAKRTIALALPHLLTFFVNRGAGEKAFLPAQHAVFDHLLYGDSLSIETMRSAGLLLDALMRNGLSPSESKSSLDALREAWRDLPSFELLDWSLDVLESLVTLQVVPAEAQHSFAAELRGQLDRWRDRINPDQIALFDQLCREAEFDCDTASLWAVSNSASEDATGEPAEHPLSGKKIALYSLRTESLRRVSAVLESSIADVDVRIFSGKVGSAELRSMARTWDLVVIVTGAAKHAATEFIEDNRPKDAQTIRCHTTGSASILRTIRSAWST